MTLASLERGRSRFHVVPRPRRENAALPERVSDVWPDWSTKLGEAELARAAGKNRPSAVLWEAAYSVAFSVGLVILLLTVLGVLHAG